MTASWRQPLTPTWSALVLAVWALGDHVACSRQDDVAAAGMGGESASGGVGAGAGVGASGGLAGTTSAGSGGASGAGNAGAAGNGAAGAGGAGGEAGVGATGGSDMGGSAAGGSAAGGSAAGGSAAGGSAGVAGGGGAAGEVSVLPTLETDPAHHAGDSADDTCVWIHPTDPAQSLVIGDDKEGGLIVWDLAGKELQYLDAGKRMNNIDIRYNFPLGSGNVDLVAVNNETDARVELYQVNAATRNLELVGGVALGAANPYGGCLYRNPLTKKLYWFADWVSGAVEQWELSGASGSISGQLVRSLAVASQVEGCVADDELGYFYLAEEDVAIWRFGAEPDSGDAHSEVDHTGVGSRAGLIPDIEGLTLYYASAGTGYLIISAQESGDFDVYRREGNNDYLGKFRVAASGSIDAVSQTDGLDVANVALGPGFPQGLLIVHDGVNSDDQASNHKFVPWQSVANALGLSVDTSFDPRKL